MIELIGYNFFRDGNAIDPTPTNIQSITSTTLKNGIFDHFNVSDSVTFDYTTIVPTGWDVDTILNADFKGTTSAGNIDDTYKDIEKVRIKRRIKGTFEWTTLREIEINDIADLGFAITDNLNQYNIEYEYAFVPIVGDTEGNYIVESIMSKFRGVFICDSDVVMKLVAGVEYSGNTVNQQIGVFQPYNRQYPVVVSNSIIQYKTGNIGGWVLPESYEQDRNIDPVTITKEKESMIKFLTNKKPKIIKDSNGNSWLVYFTGSPSLSYENNYGQAMVKISAGWTEIGDSNSKDDLFASGLIPTKK